MAAHSLGISVYSVEVIVEDEKLPLVRLYASLGGAPSSWQSAITL